MKFKLSTAILLTSLIAVCIGWIVERKTWEAERHELNVARAVRDESIYAGTATYFNASRAFDILEKIADEPEHQEYIKTQLISEFVAIYENQEDVEMSAAMVSGDFDARCIAREALYQLDCNSTDQFFDIAKSLNEFKNPLYYPELHDRESSEFKSLKKFVSDTIAIKDQMYVRGFENDPR